MKNKERIDHLEDQVQVLVNRINYLEQRITRLEAKNITYGSGGVGAPPIPTWPGFNPTPTWDPNVVPYKVTCGQRVSTTIH